MTARRAEDRWDFYPCLVDDAPASISLDLSFEDNPRPPASDTLYWLRVQMLAAGPHGMGDGKEADALHPIADQIIDSVTAKGLTYVGRLRSAGIWQLTFYGPANQYAVLEHAVAGADLQGREIEVGSKPDPDWHYYVEFLLPDAERRQWMQDRRVVDVLRQRGDSLQTQRQVDHWAYFPTRDARDAFLREAAGEGFASRENGDASSGELKFTAQVHRVDAVDLDHIHAVVMRLVEIAEQHGGDYDGWETSVEAATN